MQRIYTKLVIIFDPKYNFNAYTLLIYYYNYLLIIIIINNYIHIIFFFCWLLVVWWNFFSTCHLFLYLLISETKAFTFRPVSISKISGCEINS